MPSKKKLKTAFLKKKKEKKKKEIHKTKAPECEQAPAVFE
jgi:hypothetical protein